MKTARRVAVVAVVLGLLAYVGLSKDFYLVRDRWQRPDAVIRALDIQPGASVADLGAGGGYFVPYLADAVGANGVVYAVDVEPSITEALREGFDSDDRVQVVLGRYEDPELPDAEIDLVLIVNTFHHITDRVEYFSRLRDVLTENGRVAVIEPNAVLERFYSLFADAEHISFSESVIDEMLESGYRHSASHDFLPVQAFEVFTPERTME